MKIVVNGSVAFDYLMSFPGKFKDSFIEGQLENISLSFLVESMIRQRGGTGPNIAYTMALLGGDPLVLATAGQDFGEYRAWLDSHGVDTSAIIDIEDDYTASFFVNTDQVQNQIASFYPGAMAKASMLSLKQNAPDAELVIISPNDPVLMHNLADECRDNNIRYIFDPSQQAAFMNGEQLLHGLDGCYILTVNEYENQLIQEKTGLTQDEILDKVGGLLITKAEKGSQLILEGESYEFPIFPPEKIVEPTGAGDAFRGGLLRSMQLGLSWELAGRVGALAATYVLEQVGPQSHHFTPASFVDRFRKHEDDNGALDILLAS
ncbi:MAG: carbohydrate kinase family protein [Chloroflexota bacterium]